MPPGAGKPDRIPAVFSSPVTPGWNESPWALTPGFAPRSYPRRTPRRRQAIAHWPGYYTFDIDISRTEAFKAGETPGGHLVCMTASGVGWLIQAMVGSLGGVGRRANRWGVAA